MPGALLKQSFVNINLVVLFNNLRWVDFGWWMRFGAGKCEAGTWSTTECNHHCKFCEIWCEGDFWGLGSCKKNKTNHKNLRLNGALIPLLLLPISHSRQVYPQCQRTAWKKGDNWYLSIYWCEPRKGKESCFPSKDRMEEITYQEWVTRV